MVKKKTPVTASVKVLGKIYTASGATVSAALASLTPNSAAKGMSIVTIEKEGKTISKVLTPTATARFFGPSQGLVKEIIFKQTVDRFSL